MMANQYGNSAELNKVLPQHQKAIFQLLLSSPHLLSTLDQGVASAVETGESF